MKAYAETTFRGELTELTQEEAELIRDAVKLMVALTGDDAEEYEISKKQMDLAEKMLPGLRAAFRESNWRE